MTMNAGSIAQVRVAGIVMFPGIARAYSKDATRRSLRAGASSTSVNSTVRVLPVPAFSRFFEAMGYSAVFYPSMGIKDYIVVTMLVIIAAILASVYPAIKALKMNPADALRTE